MAVPVEDELIRDYRPEPRNEIDEFSETFFPKNTASPKNTTNAPPR
jgi:hypothetical protein